MPGVWGAGGARQITYTAIPIPINPFLLPKEPPPPRLLQVYLVSGGQVKPANKKFSSVRNDYTLQFDNRAAVEECGESGLVSRVSQMG